MIDRLNYVEVNGVKYPFASTFNTLEIFQDKYGSIREWSEALITKQKEGSIKELKFAFMTMINEGIDILNDENRNEDKLIHINEKQAGRILSNAAYDNAGAFKLVMDTVNGSIKHSKNQEATQNLEEIIG